MQSVRLGRDVHFDLAELTRRLKGSDSLPHFLVGVRLAAVLHQQFLEGVYIQRWPGDQNYLDNGLAFVGSPCWLLCAHNMSSTQKHNGNQN
ncbi:MAG TPA: hypothetical protein VJA16_22735, partial [Thermoanaerobaculia bacterium]